MAEIKDFTRPVLTISSAPENEFSRAVVICNSRDYTPSIVERIVSGAYDPLVFPMSFEAIFESPDRSHLIAAMISMTTIAFALHRPTKIVLITNNTDRSHGKEALAVIVSITTELHRTLAMLKRTVPQLKDVKEFDYVPDVEHIHIDATRHAVVGGNPFMFPVRKTERLILGCFDPRLLYVRTSAENGDLADAAWFTIPGCIYHLGKKDGPWADIGLWILTNLRYAIADLGLRRLTVCPHEDCKAHPVHGEHWKKPGALQRALRKRITATKKVIRKVLMKDTVCRPLKFDVMAVRFGGQRLAIRECRCGSKGKVTVTLS